MTEINGYAGEQWHFREMDYGNTHQWLHIETGNCANVKGGLDSLDRAQALLREKPQDRCVSVRDHGKHRGFMFFDEPTWFLYLAGFR